MHSDSYQNFQFFSKQIFKVLILVIIVFMCNCNECILVEPLTLHYNQINILCVEIFNEIDHEFNELVKKALLDYLNI